MWIVVVWAYISIIRESGSLELWIKYGLSLKGDLWPCMSSTWHSSMQDELFLKFSSYMWLVYNLNLLAPLWKGYFECSFWSNLQPLSMYIWPWLTFGKLWHWYIFNYLLNLYINIWSLKHLYSQQIYYFTISCTYMFACLICVVQLQEEKESGIDKNIQPDLKWPETWSQMTSANHFWPLQFIFICTYPYTSSGETFAVCFLPQLSRFVTLNFPETLCTSNQLVELLPVAIFDDPWRPLSTPQIAFLCKIAYPGRARSQVEYILVFPMSLFFCSTSLKCSQGSVGVRELLYVLQSLFLLLGDQYFWLCR